MPAGMSPGRRSKEGQPSKAKHSKTPKQGRLFGHGNKDGFLFCVEGRAKTSTHISPSAPCKTLIRLRATRTTRTSPPPPSFPRFPHSPQPLSPLPSSLPSSQPQLLQALARSCCRRRRGGGGEAAADIRFFVPPAKQRLPCNSSRLKRPSTARAIIRRRKHPLLPCNSRGYHATARRIHPISRFTSTCETEATMHQQSGRAAARPAR